MTRLAKIERKTEYFPIVGEVKATNDQKGIIEGYLNYIGNIDFGDDRTMAGAFKKTIGDSFARKSQQELDFLWPYLWNHDYNLLPPGGIFDADETKSGLYTKTQFNMDIQAGRELYSSFKMGTMKKQSMGYKAIRYEYVKDAGRTIRDLLEVAIMEGSAVVFPMNDLAAVDTVKNTGKKIFVMPGTTKKPAPAKKDFLATYQESLQDDWLSDLSLPWYALRQEIMNAFAMGDQPIEDTRAALAQFTDAVLAYVQQGIDLGMVEALQPDSDDSDNGQSQNYGYGYMSSDETPEQKAGRVISARNHAMMTKSIQGIQGHCNEMKSMLTAAQQQGYPQAMSAVDPPHVKQDGTIEDDAVSTHLNELLAELTIKNALRK
jgi:HK97 family phage prohead protease